MYSLFHGPARRRIQFPTINIDPLYKHAVKTAWKNGVEIKTVQVKWDETGKCVFVRNDLPINLLD